MAKLNNFNGRHMRMLDPKELVNYISQKFSDTEEFSLQDQAWKEKACRLFVSRADLPSEIVRYIELIFENTSEDSEEFKKVISSESTCKIKSYFAEKLSRIQTSFVDESQVEFWIKDCKDALKVKGKTLFIGIRAVLTGHCQGADLKTLISLIPIKNLKARCDL